MKKRLLDGARVAVSFMGAAKKDIRRVYETISINSPLAEIESFDKSTELGWQLSAAI